MDKVKVSFAKKFWSEGDILAKRTSWGKVIPIDDIMKYSSKLINKPLTNLPKKE